MKSFKQFHESMMPKNGTSVVKKIHVTQKENDKYFEQKLSTLKNGFTKINRKVTFEPDPDGVYSEGEWGYITVGEYKIYVNGDGKEYEIHSVKK